MYLSRGFYIFLRGIIILVLMYFAFICKRKLKTAIVTLLCSSTNRSLRFIISWYIAVPDIFLIADSPIGSSFPPSSIEFYFPGFTQTATWHNGRDDEEHDAIRKYSFTKRGKGTLCKWWWQMIISVFYVRDILHLVTSNNECIGDTASRDTILCYLWTINRPQGRNILY